MGNHDIDCDFCGKDQRIVGSNCCKGYVDAEKKKHEDREREEAGLDKFLQLYGFKPRQPPVEVGQKWRSVRNGREVTILELKEFEGSVAARIKGGRWLTVRSNSIVGYRPAV